MTRPLYPLEGVRVADFSLVFAGPYCTRILAEMGADVIKIEPPWGDNNRAAVPTRHGYSAYFGILNAGKRSVCLDLKSAQGKQAAYDIIRTCDVMVENFRPGVMDQLGLGYADVSKVVEKIVYCSISGYGPQADSNGKPCTAQIAHANSGFDWAFASYQNEPSVTPATGVFVADGLAGSIAANGILSALYGASRTGSGCKVDVSLLDSVTSLLAYEVATAQFPVDFRRPGYEAIPCADGQIMVAAVNERTFQSLCKIIDRDDLISDPRFKATEARWKNYRQLNDILAKWTSGKTMSECESILLEAGVPVGKYRTVSERINNIDRESPQSFVRAADGAGEYWVQGIPFSLSDGTSSAEPQVEKNQGCTRHVPSLGEDTDAVLREVADLLSIH